MSGYFERQPSPVAIARRMEEFPSWLEIDLDRIGYNIDQVKSKTGTDIIPCVKSNAYGHGAVPIVAYMMRRGIERVLVAKLSEALQLRDAGLSIGIVSMDPLFTDQQYKTVVDQDITQAVYRIETVEKLSEAAVKAGKKAHVWVKVDTGLGRVGVQWAKAAEFIKYIKNLSHLELNGTFSTLSESDELDKIQTERLLTIEKECESIGIDVGKKSIASSNAVFHKPYTYLDAVRPGLMLTGIYPEPEDIGHGIELKQALSWKARVEQVKFVEKGESLTYSRRFVAPKRMRVGTVHVGYYDGYPRGLTKKGKIRVGDEIRDVLGTVSVNHCLVDLTDLETDVGDVIEAISVNGTNDVMGVAIEANIMTYSLVNSLYVLTPRVYYENGIPVAISEPKLVERHL
jgi:alanine racemase